MKVTDFVKKNERPIISFEFTPPEKGRGIDDLLLTMEGLMPFEPQFVNVTYHQPQVEYEERDGTIVRIPRRKKPGTVGICAAIKHRFNVEPIPHFICGGFDCYETEDALIDLHYLGIENILALRGDPPPGRKTFVPEKDGHSFAAGLVGQIARMNRGIYMDALENAVPTNFCIGVAGYPEKHYESPNMDKDMEYLRQKVEQGAEFIITQIFFDFECYRSFVERARAAGIHVPIFPGLKPVTTRKQIYDLPGLFHISIPNELLNRMENARTPREESDAGIDYVTQLVVRLLEYGVPGIHVFTMGRGKAVKTLLKRVCPL